MAPVMEGTHTVLLLYPPIRELSHISLYFPKGRVRGFKYKSLAPHSERFTNDHDWGKEDLAVSEQRGQSSDSSGKLLNSQQATKEAVAELCWLAAEHHQLLADLLSLCRVCANKVRMGNQDGKLQDYMEGHEIHPGCQVLSSNNQPLAGPPEQKKATSKGKKLKKFGSKKLDSAEDFLHSKMKRKVSSETSTNSQNRASKSSTTVAKEIPGAPHPFHVSDSSVTGSYVSAVSNPILPMEETFQIGREGWDFMEDNRNFDPDMDFCADFSECDGELGYESSFCNLTVGRTRRESGSNLRPLKKLDSLDEELSENTSNIKGMKVVAKVQDVEGKVQHVNHTNPPITKEPPVIHPGPSERQQEYQKWQESKQGGEKQGQKLSQGLQLPLSNTNKPYLQTKSHLKGPSSPSLAGVFNTSFPSSNSLQSMSPASSPLSPKQEGTQLNHRIVMLSDKDGDPDQDSSSNTDDSKIFTEVIDKNGNKRTVSRLDLNLSRRPSSYKLNSSSNSTTTDDSLLRQDDIWMLDGDDPQEPISRVPRPDHLDFLRITPPEDDIIGDTPYIPRLDCTRLLYGSQQR